jgi:transcriptional regulator with XRE-family HTH domain
MSRLKSLRLEAKLSVSQFARLADLDRATVSKAEKGGAVSELSLHKIAATLSEELKRPLKPEEIAAS